MSSCVAEAPAKKRNQIGAHDGEKALKRCLETLRPLNREWRDWVLTALVDYPPHQEQLGLPFGDTDGDGTDAE